MVIAEMFELTSEPVWFALKKMFRTARAVGAQSGAQAKLATTGSEWLLRELESWFLHFGDASAQLHGEVTR